MKNHRTSAGLNANTVAGVLAALTVVVGAWATMTPPPPPELASDPVFSREVVAYEVIPEAGQEAVVKYEYLGDPLPEKLVPDEDVSLRTETSYTKVIEAPTKDIPGTYQGIYYSRPTFTRDDDVWRYIEHATTTETAFNAAMDETPLAYLFARKAHAVDFFSGSGDGYVQGFGFASEFGTIACQNSAWADAHGLTDGTNAAAAGTTMGIYSIVDFAYDSETENCDATAEIYRGFIPFVTSSIPSGATISAATLNVYVTTKIDGDNDANAYMTVVRTSQASHTTLAISDYDAAGAVTSPTEGIDTGERKDITSITASAYLSFTLNATGLSWIAKSGTASNCSATTGISCFGLREGHDAVNNRPLGNTSTGITINLSETTGTSQDPYLAVTYTGGATNAFWQFQDF